MLSWLQPTTTPNMRSHSSLLDLPTRFLHIQKKNSSAAELREPQPTTITSNMRSHSLLLALPTPFLQGGKSEQR
jgi:hypothetical protein